jgi:hypothetical protein
MKQRCTATIKLPCRCTKLLVLTVEVTRHISDQNHPLSLSIEQQIQRTPFAYPKAVRPTNPTNLAGERDQHPPAVAELQGGSVGPRTTLRSAHARPIAIGKFTSSSAEHRRSIYLSIWAFHGLSGIRVVRPPTLRIRICPCGCLRPSYPNYPSLCRDGVLRNKNDGGSGRRRATSSNTCESSDTSLKIFIQLASSFSRVLTFPISPN